MDDRRGVRRLHGPNGSERASIERKDTRTTSQAHHTPKALRMRRERLLSGGKALTLWASMRSPMAKVLSAMAADRCQPVAEDIGSEFGFIEVSPLLARWDEVS